MPCLINCWPLWLVYVWKPDLSVVSWCLWLVLTTNTFKVAGGYIFCKYCGCQSGPPCGLCQTLRSRPHGDETSKPTWGNFIKLYIRFEVCHCGGRGFHVVLTFAPSLQFSKPCCWSLVILQVWLAGYEKNTHNFDGACATYGHEVALVPLGEHC